jgi:hypothetical protein
MKIQTFSNISYGNYVSKVSDKDLDKLFIKNNFLKDSNGNFSKILSFKDKFLITKKTGNNSGFIRDLLSKPFSKERKEAFKGFLDIWNDNDFIAKNFVKMFALFSVLNHNSRHFDDANKIYSDNKEYKELFQNIITNPPKNSNVLDAFRRYKGVDCGKINRSMRAYEKSDDSRVNKEIKQIGKFLNTQVIKNPIKLYRGEGFEILSNITLADGSSINLDELLQDALYDKNKLDKINKMLVQKDVSVVQPSFMSTTTSKILCNDFGHSGFYWDLTTSPNTKAAIIEPLNVQSCMDDEHEILLQANSKIKILEAKYDDIYQKWCIKGEVSN